MRLTKQEGPKNIQHHQRAKFYLLPQAEFSASKSGDLWTNWTQARIVGGSMAAPNEFPWMAMLFYQNLTTFTSISYCAGSLINNRYVLTAAHCVHDLPGDLILKKVRFGEHNISTNPDCNIRRTYCAPRHVEINVESIILHSQLNKSPRKRFENDIALVRLKIPIRYTKEIRPICIEGHYNIPANATFLIAGWGKTEDRSRSEVLMRTTIQNRRPQVCMGEFTNVDFDPRSQICAGGLDGNDTCSGDSGAPLMMFIGHGFDQVVYQVAFRHE
ncbi:LOW QUALITY PROTEIN: melanization protease 1 [Drosophila ficusphila]|uniref:LOW QUALITY PROTEIN: melanization protease 1 n=1 Tax=Drosophila ficusphila TaxID=30025 RepID=UPI001C8A7508|nr:LOW QUALITY PROTEIN: melanization protease 1 [Drosophila ficusphila]